MNYCVFKITIILLLGDILLGSVVPNPFLRPGSKRKPSTPRSNHLNPKPIVRPNVAKSWSLRAILYLMRRSMFPF